MRFLRSEFRFLLALWRFNLSAAVEYRVSFITQMVTMFVNNTIYFVFWVLFYGRFKEVSGWGLNDMLLLFAVVTTGFGIAFVFFGNGPRLARIIEQGQLDYYLTLPRSPLLHVLASRSSVSAVGDVLFGVMMFLLAGHYSPSQFLLWIIGTVLVAAIVVAYLSIVGSMAFLLGRAGVLSDQVINALLTFSMYPNRIFHGWVRFILLTVVPAGLVSALPVQIVNEVNGWLLLKLVIIAVVITFLALGVFRWGLKRYESGNLFNINV